MRSYMEIRLLRHKFPFPVSCAYMASPVAVLPSRTCRLLHLLTPQPRRKRKRFAVPRRNNPRFGANRRRILLRKTRQLHRRMRLTTTARIQNICLKKNLATRARAQLGLRGAASRKARLRPRLRMEIREITGEFKLIGNYFRLISLSFPPPPPPLSRVAPHLRSLPPPSRSTPHHAPTRRRPPRGTPEAGIGPLTPPASRTRRLGRPPSSPGWWVLPAPSLSLSSPLLSWMQLRFATSSSPSPSNLRFRAFADFAPGACFFFWPFIGCVFFFGCGTAFCLTLSLLSFPFVNSGDQMRVKISRSSPRAVCWISDVPDA
jgi:hypothetical protein